jgi:general stress protein 26
MAKSENPPAEHSNDPKDIAHVWKMIADIDICMLSTLDNGVIRARPMSSHPREEENAVYFLTDISGHKDEEIDQESEVGLAYQKSGKWLAISGSARVLNDRALIAKIWDKDAEAWWEGPEDPRIRVLEVTPRDAQFWEGPGNVIGKIVMLAAVIVGKPPEIGENKKVDLH